MPRNDEGYVTPKWRTFWLGIGFLVLVGIGVVTVLLPELEDEPNEDGPAETHEMETTEDSETDEALQE